MSIEDLAARIPPAWRTRIRLLLFGILAVVAVEIGFLAFNATQARVVVKRYGYYTISLTFAWALMSWARLWPECRAEIGRISRRERWQTGAAIVACSLVAVLTVPITYKVLYDEMVLQATAWDLHFFREVSTIIRGYRVDGVFAPFDAYLDKRPFFFTYLVSLLHDLTGYREANAFYLNIALMPVLLAQVYLLTRRVAEHGGALAAVLAVGTLSLLAQNATGAGMEMLNLAMLLATMQLSLWYLDEPNERRLAALILAAVLLAQSRYESSLYVLPVALVALEGWRRTRRVIMPPAVILGPLLLVPYAVHNTYLSGTPLLWELHENEKTRFGAQYLLGNLHHAWLYFFSTSRVLTNSLWLSAAGPVALGLGVWHLTRRWREWRGASSTVVVFVAFGGAILGNLLLLMFYYWGQLDDPIVARLSLPTCFLMAIAIGYAVSRFERPSRRLAWAAGGCAVLAYFWSGLIANPLHSGMNTLDKDLLWERRFVAQRPPAERLIITGNSGLPWMLCQIPAIAVEQARHRIEQLRFHFENRTFTEILVFQRYRPTSAAGGYQVEPDDRLPDTFVLEPITEHRFGTKLDRVSRLVEIRPRATAAENRK